MSKKPVIGILGGIGSGKSTVARQFGRFGCAVIDADRLAHEILHEPTVVAAVRRRFGDKVLDAAGGINRRALAARVFDDPDDREFLNTQIHPSVLQKSRKLIRQFHMDKTVAAIVLDMPLLMEVGWEKKCDFLIFVDCKPAKRHQRTLKNCKIDAEQIKKREKFQISLDKKKKVAHYTVNNNSDESEVAEQVAQIFSSITKNK